MERSLSIDVHFEENNSGFFLKHSPRQTSVTPEISNFYSFPRLTDQDSILSEDRFTIVQTNEPVAIRATYGPFSTKQTVPARYIVPDAFGLQKDDSHNITAALTLIKKNYLHFDISAHLVKSVISRDYPVLRVLFHIGADPSGQRQRQKIYAFLYVSTESQTSLKGTCIPEGEDGVCLVEVVIPHTWWPFLPPPERNTNDKIIEKATQPQAYVSYSICELMSRSQGHCESKTQIQTLTSIAKVRLIPAQYPYKNLRIDEFLTILIPQYPLYSMSKMHLPVFLHRRHDENITLFIIRARVKSGVKIDGATPSCDEWNISVEKENPKQSIVRVTAFLKYPISQNISYSKQNSVLEIFSWQVQFTNDENENWDSRKIVWSVSYIHDSSKTKVDHLDHDSTSNETRKKIVTKHELNKDDVQAVLPIAKSWELINTAVLTGRQVAQNLKIFIVSQVGKIADVTLQSTCHSDDESVVKVSSSCSSVYVDGTEIRGSSNASILVKYASYEGVAKFIVWMPEFPLEVYTSDFKLSQIKGWKVPDDQKTLVLKQNFGRKRRSHLGNKRSHDKATNDKVNCRSRYQQTSIDVFARFFAKDQNSGRISYLISRRTGLRVTDLIEPLLRISDIKIASLQGKILKGKSMGRTEVQVLSPISGRVIGAKEIRVGSDKVNLTKLSVRIVSGLQLTITPDNFINNGFIAKTTVSRKMSAQYQEGLLDIDLEFSDGVKTPLREISIFDYSLLVESLDTEVVAFAPILASHHPRVIAVGEGNGDLLRVTLQLPEICRMRRNILLPKNPKMTSNVLSSALVTVQVDFDSTNNKPDSIQNDGILGKERKNIQSSDLADIINRYDTVRETKHILTGMKNFGHYKGNPKSLITSLEIGMYVILTTFCFAIVVFIISCVVYASKFRPLNIDSDLKSLSYSKVDFKINENSRTITFPIECTTNAHDWVWLGRSTLDRNPYNKGETKIRIINNPISSLPNDINDVNNISTFGYDLTVRKQKGHFFDQNKILQSEPPPVPPHRHNSFVHQENPKNITKKIIRKEHYLANLCSSQEYASSSCIAFKLSTKMSSTADTLPYFDYNVNQLTLNKKEMGFNYELEKNSPEKTKDEFSSSAPKNLHRAEILTSNIAKSEKKAFQFEPLTIERDIHTKFPKKSTKSKTKINIISPQQEKTSSNTSQVNVCLLPINLSSEMENSFLRSHIVADDLHFSNLNMNYEQIIKYFRELKESNA